MRCSLRRSAANAALLVAAAFAGGCDPPNDPTLAAIGGTVLSQHELGPHDRRKIILDEAANFDVPMELAPDGTKSTVRLILGVTLTLPDAGDDVVWTWHGEPLAVQIVPPTITFASPILVQTNLFPLNRSPGTLDVLHAASTEKTWQRGSQIRQDANEDAVLPIDGAGLWSLAYRPASASPGGSDGSAD